MDLSCLRLKSKTDTDDFKSEKQVLEFLATENLNAVEVCNASLISLCITTQFLKEGWTVSENFNVLREQ